MTDASGNVVSRYDFLPFGEELWAGVNGRTVAMAYHGNEDGFSPKFTGQERDAESGLDYFHARYFSGPEGRFLSGDPGNAGASLGDPRSWNGYAYVGNDPLTLTDPTGESWWSNLLGVLAGIGTFIGTGGDALEAAQVGLGVADTVDSAANGQFPAEGLFELLGAAASLPDSGSGGLVGTGGGYGGGSTGGMIFSATINNAKATGIDFSTWRTAQDIGLLVFTAEATAKADAPAQRPQWVNAVTSIFGYNQHDPRPSCAAIAWKTAWGDMSPFGPAVGEGVQNYALMSQYNRAIEYAGSKALRYPFKSSVFRRLIKLKGGAWVGVLANLDVGLLDGIRVEWKASASGVCQ